MASIYMVATMIGIIALSIATGFIINNGIVMLSMRKRRMYKDLIQQEIAIYESTGLHNHLYNNTLLWIGVKISNFNHTVVAITPEQYDTGGFDDPKIYKILARSEYGTFTKWYI